MRRDNLKYCIISRNCIFICTDNNIIANSINNNDLNFFFGVCPLDQYLSFNAVQSYSETLLLVFSCRRRIRPVALLRGPGLCRSSRFAAMTGHRHFRVVPASSRGTVPTPRRSSAWLLSPLPGLPRPPFPFASFSFLTCSTQWLGARCRFAGRPRRMSAMSTKTTTTTPKTLNIRTLSSW